MDDPSDSITSCVVQPLASEPDATWGIERSGEYAREQDQAIVASEQALTASYWRLGLALELARKTFSHAQWGRYLQSLGIDKTRASRARAIHRTFAAESDTADLTVKQACDRRERKSHRKTLAARDGSGNAAPPALCSSFDLVKFLVEVCHQVESQSTKAEFVTPAEANCFLSAIDEAIRELNGLRARLEQRLNA
jgi:hypothetical protein